MARPSKPSALKLVAGTARGDRANRGEPEPPLLNDLEPPPHLEPRSADIWLELAPMLRQIQVLTIADRIALEIFCDALADYRHSRSQRGDDFVTRSPKTGSPMLDQWHVAQQMAGKRVDEIGSKFGLNPAARARLTINPQGDLFGNTPAAPQTGPGRFFGG